MGNLHWGPGKRRTDSNHAAPGLADLSIFGGNGSRIDDDGPFARERIKRQHAGRCMRDAAERADEIDLNDSIKFPQGKKSDFAALAVARCRLDGITGSGAIDEN